MEDNIKNALASLNKNGFSAFYFANKQEAVDFILQQVEPGSKVAFGGSVTLGQLSLRESLEEHGINYIDYRREDLSDEERKQVSAEDLKDLSRLSFFADAYFSSANAITEDGLIFNVDGRGNRVAATIYGPNVVYIVVGKNKICLDLPAAYRRLEEIAAPLNCRRLGKKTPCLKTGQCQDCAAGERICNIYTIMQRQPSGTKVNVLIIDEELGY
ncbi:MAG: lactate utilization protein [Clostridiales bacterium]